jgi:tRNA pseudouridine55 synthase
VLAPRFLSAFNPYMFGILNINKPPSWTSRDAVNRVQKLVRPAKVGHAGTLDPLATGVLVVCIGKATRLIEYIQQLPKEYHASFLLGRTSPSDDTESEVTEFLDAAIPSREEIEAALPEFVGRFEQVPPAFSAVKIQGQRAYALARKGLEVDIKPRPIEIYELTILSYEYPKLELAIRCGSGTYVRSLGRDLATSLGTGAVMRALVRTRIGQFTVANAISPVDLALEQLNEHIQSPALAVSHLPKRELTDAEVAELRYGRPIAVAIESDTAAFDAQGYLLAILHPHLVGMAKPHINFALPS